MKETEAGYHPVHQKDEEVGLDEEASPAGETTSFLEVDLKETSSSPWWHVGPRKTWHPTAMLSAVFLCSNLACLMIGAFGGRQTAYTNSKLDSKCAAYTTQYSPLLSEVDIHYAPVEFNGTFMTEDVYRRPASPEVDAAWEALGVDYRAGVISTEEGLLSGLTLGHVQRADRYGGGFFVNVEGMHHLHCLNLMRKSLYYNYPYYKDLGTHAFKNDDQILQLHISHCVDTLRQVLMCNVDTGVLGQVWYNPHKPAAFPDFHTTHTCKNYDVVRQWAEEHQAPPVDELPANYLKPANSEDIWPYTP